VDQVWATDITYIPNYGRASSNLVAVVDLFLPRNVSAGNFPTALTWNSAWRGAWKIASYRWAESHRSSLRFRGCQFTSGDFVGKLKTRRSKISWSGRGALATTKIAWW